MVSTIGLATSVRGVSKPASAAGQHSRRGLRDRGARRDRCAAEMRRKRIAGIQSGSAPAAASGATGPAVVCLCGRSSRVSDRFGPDRTGAGPRYRDWLTRLGQRSIAASAPWYAALRHSQLRRWLARQGGPRCRTDGGGERAPIKHPGPMAAGRRRGRGAVSVHPLSSLSSLWADPRS